MKGPKDKTLDFALTDITDEPPPKTITALDSDPLPVVGPSLSILIPRLYN